jgi:hypothetical protein
MHRKTRGVNESECGGRMNGNCCESLTLGNIHMTAFMALELMLSESSDENAKKSNSFRFVPQLSISISTYYKM